MNDLEDILIIVTCVYEMYTLLNKIRRKDHRKEAAVRHYKRKAIGFFATAFNQIKANEEKFRTATRMSPRTFDILLNILTTRLVKHSKRSPVPPECRLFLTLTYLAHGASRHELSSSFQLSVSSVRQICLETSSVIWEKLSTTYLAMPTEPQWNEISDDSRNIWHLPNCVGAVHGKHISIKCPQKFLGANSHKNYYSIVLLAVCDANYTFTAVVIGGCGSQIDGSILSISEFGKRLVKADLDLPQPRNLPESKIEFPHYFVADAAFPLRPNLMRPYPGALLDEAKQLFNKRLSNAQRAIENTFGVLAARWRILGDPIKMIPESAKQIVQATVVLHNFLQNTDEAYCPHDYVDRDVNGEIIEGLWRQEANPLAKVRRLSSNNCSRSSFEFRDTLKDFFWNQSNNSRQ